MFTVPCKFFQRWRREEKSFWLSGNAVQAGLSKYSALLKPQGDGGERTEKSLLRKGQLSVREMNASELLKK